MRGRKPIRLAVHGRLMSEREAAEELGISPKTIYYYRRAHPNPDGTPMNLQDAYDLYKENRARGHQRMSGKAGHATGVTYTLNGRQVTVREAAKELGLSIISIYSGLRRHNGDMDEVYRRSVAYRETRALRKIMKALKGK